MRCSLLAIAGAGAVLVNAQGATQAAETIKQFQAALGSCLEQCNAGVQDCQQQCIDVSPSDSFTKQAQGYLRIRTVGHEEREAALEFGREVVPWSGGITQSLSMGAQSAALFSISVQACATGV